MRFTIHTANCVGNSKNCYYPNKMIITNPDEMRQAVSLDHVCAEYENSYRDSKSFIVSDVIPMDCDNDHSENPQDWLTPESMVDMLPDTPFVIVPSRHNMKVKNGAAARPKWHIYFIIAPTTDAQSYTELKHKIYDTFPFFDKNALDAARFIFGSDASEVIWHDGEIMIDELFKPTEPYNVIREGSRNNTLSRFAGRVIKRYGITDRANRIFMEQAAKCEPPLPDEELATIWRSACRFGQKITSQKGYVPPEEYEFRKTSLKPADYSDIGQARVLAREYGDELMYTAATDLLRYNGVYWEESKQKSVGAAIEFLDLQLEDANQSVSNALDALVGTGLSEADIIGGGKRFMNSLGADQLQLYEEYLTAKAYKAFVMKRRDMKYIVSALQTVKPMVNAPVSELDADPFMLNTPSRTYDLRNGMFGAKEHDPNDKITKVTNYDPSDKGKELWLDAVNEFFCNDKELIEYVQQMMGLTLLGKVFVEALIIAYGEGGNGKSTFGNAILKTLGSYGGVISADALTVGCRRNVKPELAEAKGKRLLIAAELEEGMRLNTSMVKQLCSTDEIEAEKKYKAPFHFTPSHTVLLYTNHLPKVGAMDEGIWRRLIIIPFNAKINRQSDIKNYADYLAENAGEYIMKWLIEGAEKIIRNRFNANVPKTVTQAISKYKRDNDWLSHFLDECCEKGEGYETGSGKFYSEYRSYCARTGEFTRSTTDFYNAIEQAGFVRVRKRHSMWIMGVRLIETDFLE